MNNYLDSTQKKSLVEHSTYTHTYIHVFVTGKRNQNILKTLSHNSLRGQREAIKIYYKIKYRTINDLLPSGIYLLPKNKLMDYKLYKINYLIL